MSEPIRMTIPFVNISVSKAKRDFRSLMFTFQQHLCCGEEEAATMVSIATGVCKHCWEDGSGCNCWNDE